MAKRKAKRGVVADQPKREIFPSPEWFEVPNLTPAARFYGIERVAARLIEKLPEALRKYRSACESIESFRSQGIDDTSSWIQNQWVFAEEARLQQSKWEDWLRMLADQATTYLPDLSLPCVTQKPVGLDSSEKQQPVLKELEAIKAAAIRERVKVETDDAGTKTVTRKLVDEGDRTKWTIWLQTKIVKPVFSAKKAVGKSPQAWTDFANGLRGEGRMVNHPVRGPKEIRIHRSVLAKFEIKRPDWFD